MFLGTFAWSFVFVSLPFYIETIAHGDAASTLRWTGWILGISPLVTVLTAPLWGRYAERRRPRRLYVAVQAFQGVAFFGMVVATTLPGLFLARLLLGVMGAASTVAFMMAGRSGAAFTVRRQVAAIQSGVTTRQVVGPRAGALMPWGPGLCPFVVASLLTASSLCLAALAVPRSVWGYGALRFFQVLLITPVFPLVVARIAQHGSGEVIGAINSARIAAGFLGPVMATTMLAWGPASVGYGILAALGLGCVPLALARGTHRASAF